MGLPCYYLFEPLAVPPTLAQFQSFVANVMGISPAYLPTTSPQLQYALDHAIDVVRLILGAVPAQPGAYSPYQLAVLNLAGHLLVEFAQDVSWPIVSASPSSSAPWFATLTLSPPAPTLTASTQGGLLDGPIFVVTAYAYADGSVGAPSPEASVTLTGPTGSVWVESPAPAPGAVGWYVYVGASSGAELQQMPMLQLGSTVIFSGNQRPFGSPFGPQFGPLPVVFTQTYPPVSPPAFAVSALDRLAVSGITPAPYDASPWSPVTAYAVSAPGGQAQVTYPLVADRAIGYPNAVNPGPATVLPGARVQETVFFDLRRSFGLSRFVPGVVTSAGDQGTSTGLLNPDFMRSLQFQDLQYAKTPWGLQYLALAQRAGPTLWGLS